MKCVFCLFFAIALIAPLEAASLPSFEVDRVAAAKYDFSALRARLEKAVEKGELPGVSVLVMHRDKVVFKEAFGLLDIENKRPFRIDSVCQLASTTKWISGATLMAAVDEGKLTLDEPVGKYFPPFADMPIKGSDKKGNPTIRQCFSHTSGLPGFTDFTISRDHSVPESVELLAKTVRVLEFEPGSAFHYGNTGMQVAGGAIAKATGKSFQDYMQEKILTPLGMKDTTFNPGSDLMKRAGKAYHRKPGGGFQEVNLRSLRDDGNVKGALVAGGLLSSLDDYARFLTMMRHDGRYGGRQVLSAQAAQEVQKDQTRGARIDMSPYRGQKGYGFGVALLPIQGKADAIRLGDGGALGTYAWIDRDLESIGLFFAQETLADIGALSSHDVPELVREAVERVR
jgi:CubicO group peptidase (beta-lactamase class C family)